MKRIEQHRRRIAILRDVQAKYPAWCGNNRRIVHLMWERKRLCDQGDMYPPEGKVVYMCEACRQITIKEIMTDESPEEIEGVLPR